MFTVFNRRLTNPDLTRRIIEATVQDQFFTVEFTKADGSFRKMNCRLGVNKHKKGGKDCNTNKNMLTVWDAYSEGYRNVNMDTITAITSNGVRHEYE